MSEMAVCVHVNDGVLEDTQGSHASWKVMDLRKEFSRPGKSWKMTVFMESHGKVMEFHQ